MDEKQEECLRRLREAPGEETLWACVLAFQNEPFRTASGLPFSYHLKRGKRGAYTRELFVDRREKSKSITWKTVVMSFETVRQMEGEKPLVDRPKAMGDLRGVSYIYPIFYRFGLLEAPEKYAARMENGGERETASKTC